MLNKCDQIDEKVQSVDFVDEIFDKNSTKESIEINDEVRKNFH